MIIWPKPFFVQIEITNLCNYNCPLCPRKKIGVAFRHIDITLYGRILDNLSGVSRVNLTGWGEPLCHPQIVTLIKSAKKRGKKVSLTTNASLLEGELSRSIISAGLDEIAFSVDAVTPNGLKTDHNQPKTLTNIHKFQALNRGTVRIRIQTTLIGQNENDLRQIINFAARNHIKVFRLMRLDDRWLDGSSTSSRKDESDIFTKLSRYGRHRNIRVEMAQYGTNRKLLNIAYGGLRRVAWRDNCPKLFYSCYINVDGKVTPCCNLPHLAMGDAAKVPVQKIWRGAKFRHFRNKHDSFCQGCGILTR